MAQTVVQSSSGLSPKQWSEALFAMVGKQPTPINSLAGPAPDITKAEKVLRKQSTNDMPIVRVRDLAQSAGDTVRVDLTNIIKLRAIMGDENAEGKGAKLDFSYDDIKIDMATLPVSAGGRMTQKRMQHDLRRVALAQLKGGVPNFLWQRALVHLAGARGQQDGQDWIVPPSTDPEFAIQMINPVKAPTYNRHFVVDGANLVQGGLQLASIDSTDVMILDHIDQLSAILSEQGMRMMPVRIPGDPAAGEDPIKAVVMLDHLVWDRLITDKTAGNNIRTWQSLAAERASYGNLQKHPLFMGNPFLWNGVLVRKMGDFGIRWLGGSSVSYVAQGDRYTAAESAATLPALSGYQVNRSLVLGAQALAMCEGVNTGSGVPYSMLENRTNYERNLEMAGEVMGAEKKLRFNLPDGQGNYEPTDIGVMVIDSVTRRLSV
jgi:hypothetical protein